MNTSGTTQSSILQTSNEMLTLTLPALPSSRETFLQMALPFGVSVQPFKTSTPPPHVTFPTGSINRCDYCRAFINPYVEWQVPGSRYICNLCGHVNYLKSAYQMFNISQYPELTSECVDIVVPINYQQKNPGSHHTVLLIDLNCPCIDYITQCIEAMEIHTKIALIGYGESVHLF
ncbi:Sec23/Sec24 trunk domain-containing protein [Entamoeba marina]